LIDLGILPPPSIWLFTFLALIILMSVSLVDDVVSVPVSEATNRFPVGKMEMPRG
jgi:hypothetical protein